MDFDNPNVYADTFISDGLVLDKDRMEIGGYLASNHDESSLLKSYPQ